MTSSEIEAVLGQCERLLGEREGKGGRGQVQAAEVREKVWTLRELQEDFTARVRERERTLQEAAAFFRAASKVRGHSQGYMCMYICIYNNYDYENSSGQCQKKKVQPLDVYVHVLSPNIIMCTCI